jgi:hypothetical protein
MKVKDRVIRLLEKNLLPFTPEEVRWVIETYGLAVEDEKALAQEVMAEGLERSIGTLHAFFESVRKAPLPKEAVEVEEHLRKGGTVRVWYTPEGGASLGRVVVRVETGDEGSRLAEFSFPGSGVFGELYLRAFTGVVDIETSTGLEAGSGGWAFFKGFSEEALEETMRTIISLRPVFSAMGLLDLEEGFANLMGIGEGERRMKGDCILIRDGQVRVLKRGSLVGDSELDRALLKGEPITLLFPEDVETSFKAKFFKDRVFLAQGHFRFREEVVHFGSEDGFSGHLLSATPVMDALQSGLFWKFKRWGEAGDGSFFEGLSSKVIASLKAFAELRDPFWFLTERKFFTYATAKVFVDF